MGKKMRRDREKAMWARKNKKGAKSKSYTGGEHDTSKPSIDYATFINSINSQNDSASVELSNTKKQSQNNKKNHGSKTNTELTPDQKEIEQKAIRQKEIIAMIQWSGCVALPHHCMIIGGVGAAYDFYKTENRYQFKNIVEFTTKQIANQTLENPIDIYSKSIFKIISNRGFIDNIHKDIKAHR